MSQVGKTIVPSYDSLVYGAEKVSVSHRAQALVRLCLTSVKGTARHRPGLRHQARGTGVLHPINKIGHR